MKLRKLLGILSICSALLSPLTATILAIIGINIKEENGQYRALNIIALLFSFIAWIINIFLIKI